MAQAYLFTATEDALLDEFVRLMSVVCETTPSWDRDAAASLAQDVLIRPTMTHSPALVASIEKMNGSRHNSESPGGPRTAGS
jgi:hypothetical protein